VIALGKPFLGICLGMQLLFDVSYEDGEYEGLGVIHGDVVRFNARAEFKVPHMGWNQARIVRHAPLLADVPDHSFFYFVHSYYVRPQDAEVVALETEYECTFCSMVWRDRLFATQFHPEKSQACGLQLLRNFAHYQPEAAYAGTR
jgi:glutamine amidotransferase